MTIISVNSDWLMEQVRKESANADTINIQASSIALGKIQAYQEVLQEAIKSESQNNLILIDKFAKHILKQ